jgi:hypothetical protein
MNADVASFVERHGGFSLRNAVSGKAVEHASKHARRAPAQFLGWHRMSNITQCRDRQCVAPPPAIEWRDQPDGWRLRISVE